MAPHPVIVIFRASRSDTCPEEITHAWVALPERKEASLAPNILFLFQQHLLINWTPLSVGKFIVPHMRCVAVGKVEKNIWRVWPPAGSVVIAGVGILAKPQEDRPCFV
jgi:hypothetical protein